MPMIYLVLVVVPILAFFGCSEHARVEPLRVLSDFYDRSYINDNIARGSSFFGTERYRFFSYYDTQGKVIVIRNGDEPDGISRDQLDVGIREDHNQTRSLLNPHNFISGGLDGLGRIHLVLGVHNGNPQHFVSRRPLRLGEWDQVGDWVVRAGQRMTYPYLLKNGSGDLWLFYRHGSAGRGSTYLLTGLEGDVADWRPQLLIEGKGESSQYLFSPVASANGCVHLAWTWRLSNFSNHADNPYLRETFQGVTNRDISYAKTCDGGSTWTDSHGRVLKLPIDRLGSDESRAETIAEIDIGTGFFNHYGSDYDSNNQPHFVLHHWDNEKRTQIWHLYRGEKGWVSNQVSKYLKDIPWSRYHVNGLAGTPLARPELLINRRDDSVLIITRSEHEINRLELYFAAPPYSNWRKEVVDTGSLGGWEPQVDKGRYQATHELDILLNVVRDDPVFAGFNQKLDPTQKMELERRARGETVTYPDYSILFPTEGNRLSMDGVRFAPGEAWIARLHWSPFTK